MSLSVVGAVGLCGPVLFLFAYAMVSFGRWSAQAWRFHFLNFLGAVAIVISLTEQFNLPVMVLEICWGIISIYGMLTAKRTV